MDSNPTTRLAATQTTGIPEISTSDETCTDLDFDADDLLAVSRVLQRRRQHGRQTPSQRVDKPTRKRNHQITDKSTSLGHKHTQSIRSNSFSIQKDGLMDIEMNPNQPKPVTRTFTVSNFGESSTSSPPIVTEPESASTPRPTESGLITTRSEIKETENESTNFEKPRLIAMLGQDPSAPLEVDDEYISDPDKTEPHLQRAQDPWKTERMTEDMLEALGTTRRGGPGLRFRRSGDAATTNNNRIVRGTGCIRKRIRMRKPRREAPVNPNLAREQ